MKDVVVQEERYRVSIIGTDIIKAIDEVALKNRRSRKAQVMRWIEEGLARDAVDKIKTL